MKVLVGTDIIEVERIKQAMQESGFAERVFTKTEIAYCESKSDIVKYQHYAARFAAKEAVFKAISPKLKSKYQISWKNIEITNNEDNRPNATLVDDESDCTDILNLDNISIDLSISHVKDLALATAVITIEEG